MKFKTVTDSTSIQNKLPEVNTEKYIDAEYREFLFTHTKLISHFHAAI